MRVRTGSAWHRVRCAPTGRPCGGGLPPEARTRPSLFLHARCRRLIETLTRLQHDPHRPEDVLKVDADEEGVGGDDAPDALRYLIAKKPREVRVRRLSGV